MGGRKTARKAGKRIGFGILFVAACFAAMYILMEFHEEVLMVAVAALLLLISAFLFLNAVFSDKAKDWFPPEDEQEELPSGDAEAFQSQVVKHMKEMETNQKELINALKNQNTLIQGQIENLAHEIYMLSEKQANQAKSIIKFNKENARQLAISERETLEYVMLELKKAIEDNAGPAAYVTSEPVSSEEQEAPAAMALEDVSEEELFTVSDLPGDEEYEIPEVPEDIDLSEIFDIPELEEVLAEMPVEESPAQEETPVEQTTTEPESVSEPEPESEPLAGLSSDPNAMMTPEDIAKLLEAMGQ